MVDLPNPSDRTIVIGATGTGKTMFSVWLLSTRNWNVRRWFVLDFKGEDLFNEIDLVPMDISDDLPIEPNIYKIPVLPGEDDKVSQFFMKCFMEGNCGIYIDECYGLPYQDRWVRACLTMGRSKNIEIIGCTQRPVKIDVYFFSETTYFAVFNLNVKDDRKRVSEYMDGMELARLPKYHCLWYNVPEQEAVIFEPVPDREEIIDIFKVEMEEIEEMKNEEKRLNVL